MYIVATKKYFDLFLMWYICLSVWIWDVLIACFTLTPPQPLLSFCACSGVAVCIHSRSFPSGSRLQYLEVKCHIGPSCVLFPVLSNSHPTTRSRLTLHFKPVSWKSLLWGILLTFMKDYHSCHTRSSSIWLQEAIFCNIVGLQIILIQVS